MSSYDFNTDFTATTDVAATGVALPTIGNGDLSGFAKAGTKTPPIANFKLIEMMMPVNFVVFDHNPSKFTVTKKSMTNQRGQTPNSSAGTMSSPTSGGGQGNSRISLGTRATTIDFTALLTDEDGSQLTDAAMLGGIGGGVKGRADLLLNWCTAGPSSVLSLIVGAAAKALGLGVQTFAQPPVLILQWGDPLRGHMMMGNLSGVSVNYKRFDNVGNPLRAEVTGKFEEVPLGLLSLLTNPTSGGVPGRRGHTLTQGESLQTIATSNYGRPGAWRNVAETNGIDDPFRVHPGRKLMLPPPDEARG